MAGHPRNGETFLYFRFRQRLPLTVAFASASFTVATRSVLRNPPAYHIEAHEHGTASYAGIGPSFPDVAQLEAAAYEVGLRVRLVTVGETIMRRLVREGRAEIVHIVEPSSWH